MPIFREDNNLGADSDPIPYFLLAESLYNTGGQTLVPFLGAGASLPPIVGVLNDAPPAADPALVNQVCTYLGITDASARLVLELAISVAKRLQTSSNQPQRGPILDWVRNSSSPPSAGDLAEAFAEVTQYNHFESAFQQVKDLDPAGASDAPKLARVLRSLSAFLGLGSPSPSLLEVSSYYEYAQGRSKLCDFLGKIFNEKKDQPTSTQTQVADAARSYIEANRTIYDAADYLVITTNYDGLIEIAFDRTDVPYCVLTVPQDGKVSYRLSANVQAYFDLTDERFARYRKSIESVPPSSFTGVGKTPKPLVILYKIHGDLYPPNAESRPDSIVISDDDYVRYINQDARGGGMVPALITKLLDKREFLILGYRFADWNVRSLYRSIEERRVKGENQRDWVVLRKLGRYERTFFDGRGFNMVETALDTFWSGIARCRNGNGGGSQ